MQNPLCLLDIAYRCSLLDTTTLPASPIAMQSFISPRLMDDADFFCNCSHAEYKTDVTPALHRCRDSEIDCRMVTSASAADV